MCHLSPADLTHKLAKSEQKNGLVFVDPEMFAEIDEPICEIMQSSRAIISHSLNIKELFGKIVAKVKGSEDDEEKEDEKKKDWTDILRCIVFIVSKEDFEDVKSSCQPDAKPLIEESMRINGKDMTEIEYFFACMEKWGGIDISRLWYHLCQLEDKSVSNIKSQFLKCLEEVNEEEKEFDERCKKVEDKPELLAKEKTARAELMEKRAKEVTEKKASLFTEKKKVNLVESLAAEALAKNDETLG
jgi:hypothetical protein